MWKILMLLCLVIQSIVAPPSATKIEIGEPDCDSEIYCHGKLLETIMMAHLHKHPKHFVDQKLLDSPKNILKKFKQLEIEGKLTDKDALEKFLGDNFAEDPLSPCTLTDIKEKPKLIEEVADHKYKEFLLQIYKIWPQLAGQVDEDVKNNPDRHSFIYLPKCYIKAGGFFTSQFYWDSNWIIEGLILNEMTETAKGMLENFFSLIDQFDFVLNANRKYYSKRSQPPFLTKMMKSYMDAKPDDRQFLIDNLHRLDQEFDWWMKNRMIEFTIGAKTYKMYQYRQKSSYPRPEGFTKDYSKAQELHSIDDRNFFYTQTHSVAESGIDFSSRQRRPDFHEPGYGSRKNLDITRTVPVELNSLLAMNARYLSVWHKVEGKADKAKYYEDKEKEIIDAIHEVMWNEELGAWFDWDIEDEKQRIKFYPSNLMPLYTKSYHYTMEPTQLGNKAVNYLIKAHIITNEEHPKPKFFAVPASMLKSPEQWDYENGWSPHQAIVIEGLHNTRSERAVRVAEELAKIWMKTNYEGFYREKAMFEKYSATELGKIGGKGTYDAQTGFGWTNGFCMVLFKKFGSILKHTDYENFVVDETGVDKTTPITQ